jgi:hypothetical protein
MSDILAIITTRSHEGRRRYSLMPEVLKTEVLSRNGVSIFSSRTDLADLSDEFSVHSSGSYVNKSVMVIALLPLLFVVLLPLLVPSLPIESLHLFIGFAVWFFCWVVFGSHRDVCFWIYTRNGKDVLKLVGRSTQQEQLQSFVREVAEQVRKLSSVDSGHGTPPV